ncbi:MAG: hypothetical protein RIQ52_1099 [Pseudomonadota bacterium]|jgi:sulfate transport system substrate-binding protein
MNRQSSGLHKLALSVALTLGTLAANAADVTLLNASNDPTRELFEQYNTAFKKHWASKAGETIEIKQSHGGSGKQARAVIDGLDADVVTLALAYDIDQLHLKGKLIPENWQSRLPHNSSPFTSTMVFLVRKGNPQQIHDWADLVKPGVSIITPNPKTSGGARWNYMAAWGYALKGNPANEAEAKTFVEHLYRNTAVLDSGARGSTVSFVERELGDVLITWENEAHLTLKEYGKDQFEVIYPSTSIMAEPPVAVVDQVVRRHGTEKAAEEYLHYLYSPEGQEIIAQNFYRPRDPAILKKYASVFPEIRLFTIQEIAGDWHKAQAKHFADGGIFDQIYQNR